MGILATLILLGLAVRMLWGRKAGGDEVDGWLASAEAAGIITAEQRGLLREHAIEHGQRKSFGGAVWLAIFAGLFVVAGISLLVASNWASIGAAVRVVAFLVLLGITGEAAARARGRGPALAISLEVFWFLLPLVGIGLYGQTFQLSGDELRPFLVWLALTAPLAWLTTHYLVALVHTVALTSVLFVGNFGVGGMLTLLQEGSAPIEWQAWILSLVMLGLIVVQSLRLLPEGNRHHFLGVIAFWVLGLLATPTVFRLAHDGWMAAAGVALMTAWLAAVLTMRVSTSERMGAAIAWLGALYVLTFAWHDELADGATTTGGIVLASVAIVTALGLAARLPRNCLADEVSFGWLEKTFLVLPLLLSLLLVADGSMTQLVAFLCNVLLVAMAVALMWYGSIVRRPAEINLGVGVLLIVLVTRFIDLFGSMLAGGVGFIVAGILLASLAYALQRARRRLIDAPAGGAR
jgi:uncharacterized membrane protein